MALPIDQRVILIVGLTLIVIVVVIVLRVLTGRKWRNRLTPIDNPNNQGTALNSPFSS